MTAVDLEAIVSDEMRQAPTAFELESFDVEASNVRAPLARVRVRLPGGEVESGSFTGDGPVDAFFSAINAAVGHDARLREFHVSAVTGGRDALGEVTVLLELNGALASGVGRVHRHPRGVRQGLPARALHGARQGRAGLGRLGGRGGRGASRARAALDAHTLTMADFTWRDGERLVRFRRGALEEAVDLIAAAGLSDYALLTPSVPRRPLRRWWRPPTAWSTCRPGKVDEVSAGLLGDVEDRDVVALGGGRVIDTAKAIAGVFGRRCAALPTTLSGAEMTPFHRTPAGVEGARLVRPALVVADPDLMATQPGTQLAASAMNAMAHAMEALYTPLANPVGDGPPLAAAAALLAAGDHRGSARHASDSRSARCWPATRRARRGSRCTTPSARASCAWPARRTPRRTR